jgi:hypothetical protein
MMNDPRRLRRPAENREARTLPVFTTTFDRYLRLATPPNDRRRWLRSGSRPPEDKPSDHAYRQEREPANRRHHRDEQSQEWPEDELADDLDDKLHD